MHSPILLVALAALFAAARSADVVQASTECAVMGATGPDLEWDYNKFGNHGPAAWSNLYETCKGLKQSPIDFPIDVEFASRKLGPKPSFKSIKVTAAATNNNFALACPVAGTCGHTMMGGVNYTVANAHFHAPSEHRLNGQEYPLELHIVHANPDATKFLVLAIMFKTPRSDSYAAQVYDKCGRDYGVNTLLSDTVSHVAGPLRTGTEFEIPLSSVVNADLGFCAYGGSLTTPPCTEAVTFYMSMFVPTVTNAQVFEYARAAGAGAHGNNRPLQPLNGRNVTCYIK